MDRGVVDALAEHKLNLTCPPEVANHTMRRYLYLKNPLHRSLYYYLIRWSCLLKFKKKNAAFRCLLSLVIIFFFKRGTLSIPWVRRSRRPGIVTTNALDSLCQFIVLFTFFSNFVVYRSSQQAGGQAVRTQRRCQPAGNYCLYD